ncbi:MULTISPECIES: hypothetical protein [Xanthocytophaga]|uniref:Peptidase M23 n=2 Tax=Xanthocytophaga TaxID=3078918 RepID=A0AAE3QSS7_9BACT|nr:MULTISPECIES: hypothetical protein [Xanthocytophaga]MDJ1484281.1 hypothetical protein [Xanthocytophaga flavus]MDJ1503438.1 hypothetical protein [Xanthocytophaga agilis]
MKKYKLSLGIALVSLGLIAGACSSNRNMSSSGNKVEQAADKADAELDKERADLKLEIQQGLDKLDTRLDKLRAEAKDASGDAKDNLDEQVKKLEKSRDRMNNYLSDVGKQTKSNWQKFKADVRSSFEEVKEDIKD